MTQNYYKNSTTQTTQEQHAAISGGRESTSTRAIGMLELTSLTALLDYVADQQNHEPEDIARQFCDRFNIETVDQLSSFQFEAAVRYLVDQVPSASAVA